MYNEKRFEKNYSQGDMTPLLDKDGKSVVTPVSNR